MTEPTPTPAPATAVAVTAAAPAASAPIDDTSIFSTAKSMFPQFSSAYATQLLSFAAQSAVLMSAGAHLGTDLLAVVGITFTVTNCFVLAMMLGFASTLDTSATAIYGVSVSETATAESRERAKRKFVNVTKLAVFIMIILSIPLCMFLLNVGGVLRVVVATLFGRGSQFLTDNITSLCGMLCPFIVSQGLVFTISKSLQAEHRADIPALGVVCGAVLGISVILLSPIVPAWKLQGVAVAMAINTCSQLLAIIFVLVVVESRRKEEESEATTTTPRSLLVSPEYAAWFSAERWTSEVLKLDKIWTFLKLSIANVGNILFEWGCFEGLMVIAALSDEARRASHPDDAEENRHVLTAAWSVLFNVTWMMFSCQSSLAIAVSSWTGRLLGERQPARARTYAIHTVIFAFVCGLLQASLLVCLPDFIFSLYGVHKESSGEEYRVLRAAVGIFVPFHVGDQVQYAIGGIYRGVGRPEEAPLAVALGLGAVGLGSAYLFGVVFQRELVGIVGGFACGMVVELAIMALMSSRWDWKVLSDEAVAEHEKQDELPASPV